DQLYYTYPKFYREDQILAAVRNTSGKMSLAVIDADNGRADYLTPFSYNVIGFPCSLNDTLYFSASYHKNDGLFAYTFSDKKVWLITHLSKNGVGKYQPSVNNENIVWSTFTAGGYRLEECAKNELQFKEMSTGYHDHDRSDFGINALQKTSSNLLDSVPISFYLATKYHKGPGLFNFHSIEPAADDPE